MKNRSPVTRSYMSLWFIRRMELCTSILEVTNDPSQRHVTARINEKIPTQWVEVSIFPQYEVTGGSLGLLTKFRNQVWKG